MDEQLPDSAPKKATPTKGFISEFMADAMAITSSLAAGALTAWSVVQRSTYKNLSSLGAFDDMKPKRKKDYDAIEALREKNLISKEESFLRVDRLVEMNDAEAAKRMADVGIKSVRTKWEILRTHQKIEALSYAFVAAGVALGSLLPLLRSVEKPESQEPTQPPITGR